MFASIRQIKNAVVVLNAVLALLTVIFLVSAVRGLFGYAEPLPEPLEERPPVETVTGGTKLRPYGEFAALRKSNLFGARSSSNVAPKKTDERLPETTLALELLGCVSTGVPESSYAIIRNKRDRKEDTYSVGDFIVPDAKVEEIRHNEVVILRGGRRETLSMEFSKAGGTPGFTPDAGRRDFQRTYSPRVSPPRQSSSSTGPAIRVASKNVRIINRDKLTEEVSENMGSLLNQFRTRPNIVDNNPSGLQVDAIGSDPLSSQLGLEAGDIVKRVNGVRVNSLEDILALSERLQRSREVRVVIERSGRHTTLIYKMQ